MAGAPPPISPTAPIVPYAPGISDPTEEVATEGATALVKKTSNIKLQIEEALKNAGVDITAPEVQYMIDNRPDLLSDPKLGPLLVAQFAQLYPSGEQTAYDQLVVDAGFENGFQPVAPSPGIAQLAAHERLDLMPKGAQFNASEDGAVLYKNGVLVTPDGQVVYQENDEAAAGSRAWLENARSTWSDETVLEWRKKLVEFGYLPKEQSDGAYDVTFETALRAYQEQKYLHFGKPIVVDASAGASLAAEIKLSPADLQAEIRGSVTEQFIKVFGDEPSDAELSSWSRWLTDEWTKLQKKLVKKGVDPVSALGVAGTQADELFIEKLGNTPQVEYATENFQENTRLRDAMQSAVITTSALET